MRYALELLLASTILGLFGVSESEAACRAAGEYRVTGPNSGGFLTLKETSSDASSSSGTVDLALGPKGGCQLCDFAVRILTGEYHTAPVWDGSCLLILNGFDPALSIPREVDGTLAFGGAVIFFEGYSLIDPGLNLTLGIRTDSLLRP